MDLKVGWGIIGGTAGFLILILVVISFFNRYWICTDNFQTSSDHPWVTQTLRTKIELVEDSVATQLGHPLRLHHPLLGVHQHSETLSMPTFSPLCPSTTQTEIVRRSKSRERINALAVQKYTRNMTTRRFNFFLSWRLLHNQINERERFPEIYPSNKSFGRREFAFLSRLSVIFRLLLADFCLSLTTLEDFHTTTRPERVLPMLSLVVWLVLILFVTET